MSKLPPSLKSLQKQIDQWNTAHSKPGVPVIVKLDDGSQVETVTESQAWVLGGHSAVILLKDISGAYLLNRVRHNPKTK